MTDRILRAYYDLAVAPPSYDICVFLYLAEMERMHLGLDAIDLIVVANNGTGFRYGLVYQPVNEMVWRLHHIVLPAHRLIPTCRRALYYPDRAEAEHAFDPSKPVFPAGYTVDAPIPKYQDSDVLIGLYSGRKPASLRAPASAIEKVESWLDHRVGGRKAVTITLREDKFQPSRNSDLEQWIRFARWLDPEVYQPVFVRDTAALFKPPGSELRGDLVFNHASLDIELRLALYERAYINLFVDSGPAVCCMMDDLTRCIRFKLSQKNNPHSGNANFYRRGYSEGMQWAGTTSHQVSVWEDDTADCIAREFATLDRQVQSGTAASPAPLPPIPLVAQNFIYGDRAREAITVTSLALDANPDDLEARFLLATALMCLEEFLAARKEFLILFKVPHAQATVLIPLANCLWRGGKVRQAIDLLTEAARQQAENLPLLKAIAQLLLDMGAESAGTEIVAQLVKARPNDTTFLAMYADHLRIENLTMPDAVSLLEKAVRLQPDDPTLHYKLASCHFRTADFERAIYHTHLAMRLSGQSSLKDWINIGRWSKFIGNESESRSSLLKAHAASDIGFDDMTLPTVRSVEWHAHKALIAVVLGNKGAAHSTYRTILEHWKDRGLWYDPQFYLPGTSERVERLRDIVRGRDVFIFCHGPTISAMDRRWVQFAESDACLMAVNRFRVFETGFLSQTHSHLDVVIATHYRTFQRTSSHILEFLSRGSRNMLITHRWAIERMGMNGPSRQELEGRFDDRLFYYGEVSDSAPATPSHPMRFLYSNTLTVLIVMAAIGRARRIFLFGADSRLPADGASPTHYGAESADFRLKTIEDHRARVGNALISDTMNFGDTTEIGLIAAEHLYGVTRPPIYNVSPDSAIDLFPRMTYDDALELLRTDPSAYDIPASVSR